MADDVRWRSPPPDPASDAAPARDVAAGPPEERAATRGSAAEPALGEAPDEAAPQTSGRDGGRRRRGRGGKRGAHRRGVHEAEKPPVNNAAAGAPPVDPSAATKPDAAGPSRSAASQRGRNGRARRRGPIFAALDLGTNNCRLLVARAEGEGFQIIDAFSRVVRLGEGLSDTGALAASAVERSLAALSICADRVAKHRVTRLRAIATEACRRAANQRAFIERVRDVTGIHLEVIEAEEEARLAVAGCAPLLDQKAEELLVFDIGGGSTELIWIDLAKTSPARRRALVMALAHSASKSDRARAAASHVKDWVSIPAGVVTLGEEYDRLIDDDVKFGHMHAHVERLIAPFRDRVGPMTPERLVRMQMLGTSGTITTLAGVHLDLERYSRRAVDGLWIASDAVDRVIERLLGMNAYERASIPCIGEDRATNLMAGAAILRTILRAWPTRRLRVADRGLREGMLYGLIQDGIERRAQTQTGARGRRPG